MGCECRECECPLGTLWVKQAEQQGLWYKVNQLSDDDRGRLVKDLLLGLHEEASELQRAADKTKYHLLTTERLILNRDKVVEEAVDVVKYVVAVLQAFGVGACEFCERFDWKTTLVEERWRAEQVEMGRETLVFVTDLDGCLANFHGHPESRWFLQQVPEGDLKAALEVAERKKELYRGDFFRQLLPFAGASEALSQIRAMGVRVVVLTARPAGDFPMLHTATTAWLREYAMAHDLLLFSTDKWGTLERRIAPARVVAAVDDMPREVWELARHGVPTIVYDRPHNQGLEGPNIEREDSWEAILENVSAKVSALRHGPGPYRKVPLARIGGKTEEGR